MPLFQPHDHTKLMNLLVMLGYSNQFVEPILLNKKYPLKEIGLKIHMPEYNPSNPNPNGIAPDCAYSSTEKNAVLFLEAKSGGVERDQLDKFEYLQENPNPLIRTDNRLEISEENLTIDFGIVCSDVQKIKKEDERGHIKYPILYCSPNDGILKKEEFNGESFLNNDISDVFARPIVVSRIPSLYIPFCSYDYENNGAYIIKKLITILIAESEKLEKMERLPPLAEIIKKSIVVSELMSKSEFEETVKIVEKILKNLFYDENADSQYNIKKYISHRNGNTYIKKSTLKKFLDRMEDALNELEKCGKITIQSNISDFEKNTIPSKPNIGDQIDFVFDPDKIFS